MSDLKPCPFCGGEVGEIKKDSDSCKDGYWSWQSIYIYCSCGVKLERQYKSLAKFTDYTVQDFRQNPVLRARVEDDYEQYINDEMLNLIKAWNKRTDGWIPVSERLPEDKGWYCSNDLLVKTYQDQFYAAKYIRGEFVSADNKLVDVVEWKPITPSEDKDNDTGE